MTAHIARLLLVVTALGAPVAPRPHAPPMRPAPDRRRDLCVALASTSPAYRADVEDAARLDLARLHLRRSPLGVDLDDAPMGDALARLAPRFLSTLADASLAIDASTLDPQTARPIVLDSTSLRRDDRRDFLLWPATRSLHLRLRSPRARHAAHAALAEEASRRDGLVSAVIPARIEAARCDELFAWLRNTVGELPVAVAGLPTPTAVPSSDLAITPHWTTLGPDDLLVVPRASSLGRLDDFARVALGAAHRSAGAVEVIRPP